MILEQIFRQAIAGKRLVSFEYQGHARIVEAHVLGIKNDVTGFQAYKLAEQAKAEEYRIGSDYIFRILFL